MLSVFVGSAMKRLGADIRQNLIASTILGPLRSVVPAVLAVFLYPMLLHAGGLELVGIWGVLQLIVNYIGLCAAGLPSLMIRKVAANGDSGAASAETFRLVLGGYLLGGAGLLACVVSFAEPLWRVMQLPSQPNVMLALVTTVLAGVVANIASIYAAVLSGLHRSYLAQMAETIGAISQFAIATAFILHDQPFLGLAISLLAGKLTILVVAAAAMWRRAPEYFAVRPSGHLISFVRLLGEAKGFILLDTGNSLREPMVRALLVVMAGPSELALFDMANRLPVLIRNSFSYGLAALLPAVTALAAQQRLAGMSQALRASMAVVTVLIIPPLAAYVILAKPVLYLWLGNVGTQVSTITLVATAWWIVTAYNIPFYITVQALGLEGVAARNVWLHILLIALGSASFYWIGVDAVAVSWLVLITGVVSQVQLYVEAQSRARLLTIAFATGRDRIVAMSSVVLLASAVWLRVDETSVVTGWARMFGATAIFFSIWLAILGIFTSGHPVRFFLWTLRARPSAGDGA